MKVKGYFNVNNGVFLGPMTATNEATGVASTPRYIEGVCFGEYDTDTDQFVPQTNPMHIPKGMIFTQDERIREDGKLENFVTGMVEDKGADIVARGLHVMRTQRTPNVVTMDESGKVYEDRPVSIKPRVAKIENEVSKEPKPRFLTRGELPDLDFENLF
jgi:hypothetical protein